MSVQPVSGTPLRREGPRTAFRFSGVLVPCHELAVVSVFPARLPARGTFLHDLPVHGLPAATVLRRGLIS
jgi:hypothetical protein